MLTTLVEATGHALTLIIDQPDGSDTRLNGPLGRRMRRLRARLLRTIERYGGSNPQVFGSVARGTEGPDSDVDLLVDLPEDKGLFALMRLQRDLESILHTRVDLVPADALKPTARPRIERDLVPL
jgi:predicted nucleotidyltransferase